MPKREQTGWCHGVRASSATNDSPHMFLFNNLAPRDRRSGNNVLRLLFLNRSASRAESTSITNCHTLRNKPCRQHEFPEPNLVPGGGGWQRCPIKKQTRAQGRGFLGDRRGPEGHRKLRPLSPVRYLAVYRHRTIDRVCFLGTRPIQTKRCTRVSEEQKAQSTCRWVGGYSSSERRVRMVNE